MKDYYYPFSSLTRKLDCLSELNVLEEKEKKLISQGQFLTFEEQERLNDLRRLFKIAGEDTNTEIRRLIWKLKNRKKEKQIKRRLKNEIFNCNQSGRNSQSWTSQIH